MCVIIIGENVGFVVGVRIDIVELCEDEGSNNLLESATSKEESAFFHQETDSLSIELTLATINYQLLYLLLRTVVGIIGSFCLSYWGLREKPKFG